MYDLMTPYSLLIRINGQIVTDKLEIEAKALVESFFQTGASHSTAKSRSKNCSMMHVMIETYGCSPDAKYLSNGLLSAKDALGALPKILANPQGTSRIAILYHYRCALLLILSFFHTKPMLVPLTIAISLEALLCTETSFPRYTKCVIATSTSSLTSLILLSNLMPTPKTPSVSVPPPAPLRRNAKTSLVISRLTGKSSGSRIRRYMLNCSKRKSKPRH